MLYRAGEFEKADEVYRQLRQTTWAHQLKSQVPNEVRFEIFPATGAGKFTQENPDSDWVDIAFDDSAWEAKRAQFLAHQEAEWEKTFYVRRKFNMERIPENIYLSAAIHGAECDVYINGVFIQRIEDSGLEENGGNKPYHERLPRNALEALVVGDNVLAYRCRKVGKSPRLTLGLTQIHRPPNP